MKSNSTASPGAPVAPRDSSRLPQEPIARNLSADLARALISNAGALHGAARELAGFQELDASASATRVGASADQARSLSDNEEALRELARTREQVRQFAASLSAIQVGLTTEFAKRLARNADVLRGLTHTGVQVQKFARSVAIDPDVLRGLAHTGEQIRRFAAFVPAIQVGLSAEFAGSVARNADVLRGLTHTGVQVQKFARSVAINPGVLRGLAHNGEQIRKFAAPVAAGWGSARIQADGVRVRNPARETPTSASAPGADLSVRIRTALVRPEEPVHAGTAAIPMVTIQLQWPDPPLPKPIESANVEVTADPVYREWMTSLERCLRSFVPEVLSMVPGEKSWISRVPMKIRNRWIKRQEEDRVARRPVFAPIHYADFMDLAGIICEERNWSEAFASIFVDRADVMVSFRRIRPVRNALSHSRPLDQADVLTLCNEGGRIFAAMKWRDRN